MTVIEIHGAWIRLACMSDGVWSAAPVQLETDRGKSALSAALSSPCWLPETRIQTEA